MQTAQEKSSSLQENQEEERNKRKQLFLNEATRPGDPEIIPKWLCGNMIGRAQDPGVPKPALGGKCGRTQSLHYTSNASTWGTGTERPRVPVQPELHGETA